MSLLNSAWTVQPTGAFWQITICPWFLRYGIQRQFKRDSDITKSMGINIGSVTADIRRKLQIKIYKPPTDGVSLFDKILLHQASDLSQAYKGKQRANVQKFIQMYWQWQIYCLEISNMARTRDRLFQGRWHMNKCPMKLDSKTSGLLHSLFSVFEVFAQAELDAVELFRNRDYIASS